MDVSSDTTITFRGLPEMHKIKLTQSCCDVLKNTVGPVMAAPCNSVCLFPNQRPSDHISEGHIKSHYAETASCSLLNYSPEAK